MSWPDGRDPLFPRMRLRATPRSRRWLALTLGGFLAVPAYYLTLVALWIPYLMPLGLSALFTVTYCVARASDASRPALRSVVSIASGVAVGTAVALAFRSSFEVWPVALAASLATAFSVAAKGSAGAFEWSRSLFVFLVASPAIVLWEIHGDKALIYHCSIPLLLAIWEETITLKNRRAEAAPLTEVSSRRE